MNGTGTPQNLDPQAVGRCIRELRRQCHISQGELARRLDMRQGPVCNIEQGKNLPSAQVLLRLAQVLNVPVDHILQPGGYLRPDSAPETAAPALLPAARYAPALPPGTESAIRDYLSLEDICQVPRQARLPLQLAFNTTPPGLACLANQLRTLLGIGDAVVFDHLELFENHGLRVIFMPLPQGPHASLAFYDAHNANVFIFIRDDLNPEKQIFSLVYGLARILLLNKATFSRQDPFSHESKTDKAARLLAACFLMPESVVRNSVQQTGVRPDEWDLDLLLRLKHRFGVSAETFNYRLLELELITPERQSELRDTIKAHYAAHNFAEPGNSRRILSPNGRLGDLLHTALRRADPEAPAIADRLKELKIEVRQ